jgi:hypothetical protein
MKHVEIAMILTIPPTNIDLAWPGHKLGVGRLVSIENMDKHGIFMQFPGLCSFAGGTCWMLKKLDEMRAQDVLSVTRSAAGFALRTLKSPWSCGWFQRVQLGGS